MNSDDVRRRWARRSGEFSPDYYAYYGPDEASEAVRRRLDGPIDSGGSVLELGCSSGRHLAHLREHGYEDVYGIDINDESFEVMADAYPELAATGTFHAAPIKDVVTEFPDDRFDAVFSVETLQHLHADDAWVFEELVRITETRLLTVENEGGDDTEGTDAGEVPEGSTEAPMTDGVNYVNGEFPLYYRDWHRIFAQRGCTEVASESVGNDTLRAFRPDER
ncbi:class I SAM-dependent methyltransferase [Halobacteriales archaeon QS_1_67_19]|nr:MAG: class I SAM-dependent methyltransferase [Halobacteriales archaeon QS_1_67_19]